MPIETIIPDDEILTDAGFYWRERKGVKVLVSRGLEDAGFVNGFSTRLGGVSSIRSAAPARLDVSVVDGDLNLAGFNEDSAENIFENRRRFLGLFDGNYELTSVWQVHGDDVKIVASTTDAERTEDRADAIVSDLTKTLAGVKTADCVPILIGDPKNQAYAAVHSGWRGTSKLIARRAVQIMHETYGSDPADLICAIGPAALCGNYEVGADVVESISQTFRDHERYFTPTREGHALVDLHLANEDLLADTGVNRANIFRAPFCTMERTDLFFSYRIEKAKYGRTGRLMSVIGLAEA